MTVTFGFFNSVAGDRVYDAISFGDLFSTFIKDGVFRDLDAGLAVSASTGITVNVGKGWAWFNGTWTRNDSTLAITLPAAASSNRYDAIVIEVDKNDGVRANYIKYVSGTAASTPSKPTMSSTGNKYQYPLAYIYRPANSTQVLSSNIEATIGTLACPWATNRLASPRESPSITSGTGNPAGGADGDIYFKVV